MGIFSLKYCFYHNVYAVYVSTSKNNRINKYYHPGTVWVCIELFLEHYRDEPRNYMQACSFLPTKFTLFHYTSGLEQQCGEL